MSVVKLSEAIKALKGKSGHVKLVNGEVLEGAIQDTFGEMFTVKVPDKGAGQSTLTVPFSAVLYLSDCQLSSSSK